MLKRDDIWAKSASIKGQQGESLIEHTCKCISVLKQIKARSPFLADIAKEQRLWQWAFCACLIHDFGKSAKSFQRYLRGTAPHWKHRHEVLSVAFLPLIIKPDTEDFAWVSAAILSHHKDAREIIHGSYDPFLEPEDLDLEGLKSELDTDSVQRLFDWTKKTIREAENVYGFNNMSLAPMFPSQNELQPQDFIDRVPENILVALKAYYALIRRITKESGTDKLGQTAILLRGIMMQADHLASAHAPELKNIEFPDRVQLTRMLGITEEALWDHQKKVSITIGSIVFSAPTGSGKTESALLWARGQQVDAGACRHMIYLLPYQASLNAIYKRFKAMLECEPALIHGGGLQALYREILDRNGSPFNAEKEAKRANNLSRLYHPPLWCTTPYQLLKAAYRLPGYEALWTAMAGALIVVDEVHAYEPVRLGMFLELLSELKNRWGATICTMTATMPSWLKRLLLSSIADREILVDKGLFEAFRRHRVEIIDNNILDKEIYTLIKDDTLKGKSVLVCANTVKTAQKVRDTLLAMFPDKRALVLIHSRFTSRDRLKKEDFIQERIGLGGSSIPLIVVATQVIEVSLNLDFDTIITEPAPLEALMQRFGRVNRKGRKGIVPVRVLKKSLDDGYIYDKELVSRALHILEGVCGEEIDELKATDWLNDVYNGIEDKWIGQVSFARKEFNASCITDLKSFDSSHELAKQFDELFDNIEVLPISLQAEYDSTYGESVLEAKGLLVPVPWRTIKRLGERAYFDKKRKTWIADIPYDSETGLMVR